MYTLLYMYVFIILKLKKIILLIRYGVLYILYTYMSLLGVVLFFIALSNLLVFIKNSPFLYPFCTHSV